MPQQPVIALYLALGVIILAARIGGSLARQFNQPRVLGELIVGVLLGPTLIDLLHTSAFGLGQAHLEETISELAELGVLLLMFKVGLDVHINELLKVGLVGAIAGTIGALLPVAVTVPIVLAAGYSIEAALFAGVTLAATSVSISAQVLLELNVLQTRVGSGLLAAALIDDILAILLVSFVVAFSAGGPGSAVDAGALLGIAVTMFAYIAAASAVAWFVLPRLINRLSQIADNQQSYGIPAFAFVFALLFGWSAEYFAGVAAITGAFIAGVGLSRAREGVRRQIDTAVSNIAYVFLVPIFFVSVGLQIDLSAFPLSALPFALLILVVAVLTKVVGCGLGARLGGFNNGDSLRLGVCMVSRGEVGLIIASLGVSSGVLSTTAPLFATLFLVILLTTVLTPPLVRALFQRPQSAAEGA